MSKIKDSNKVYGQTISIRYFADKRLKPRPYYSNGQRLDSFPLYIEIKVKRQTSQRKSALDEWVVPEMLEQFLSDKADVISMEIDSLRAHITSKKPFDNVNFSLSQSLGGYSALHEHMPYIIGEILRTDYKEAREKDSVAQMESDINYNIPELLSPNWDIIHEEQVNILLNQARDIFYRGKYDDIIHPVAVFGEVRDLAVSDKPSVKALYERYGKHFWGIDRYFQFISANTPFRLVSINIFLSQSFKKTFIECFTKVSSISTPVGEEIYNSIYLGLKQLKRDKPSDKKLISLEL